MYVLLMYVQAPMGLLKKGMGGEGRISNAPYEVANVRRTACVISSLFANDVGIDLGTWLIVRSQYNDERSW